MATSTASRTSTDPRKQPVSSLKGVGKAMTEKLERLDIKTVNDLLMHMPSRYQRLLDVRPLKEWVPGRPARIEVTVRSLYLKRGKRPFITAKAEDENGDEVTLTWFGRPWLAKQLKGKQVICQGELAGLEKLALNVEEFLFSADAEDDDLHGGLRPIYPATDGLSQARIRALIAAALDAVPELPEALPASILDRYELPPLREALVEIHQPSSAEGIVRGRERLVFSELFPAQLALLLLRRLDSELAAPALSDLERAERSKVALPFTLSPGQLRAWKRISARLAEAMPARLLLQGEVGSGKTVLAALAAAQAAGSGRLAALLAPTEVLAYQHAERLREFLAPADIEVECITGSTPAAEREQAIARLLGEESSMTGTSRVVVGTHALLSEQLAVLASRLGLLIVDEQHRFGVDQRHLLVEAAGKAGSGIHLLQLSATPIPRSLAMTVFGDLDVIDLPVRRDALRQVRTLVTRDDPSWLDAIVEAEQAGAAAFIVCHRIGDADSQVGVLSAELAEKLHQRGIRFEVAHGRMPALERRALLERFNAGEFHVLVATTVIEVGIDIPRATTMVILEAERFGLAQLHQLRGRVGRTGQQGLCLLVPSVEAPGEALGRLQLLATIDDGIELAKRDLALRGSGAVLGESQSGASGFRIARLDRDGVTLARARHAAKKLLRDDPRLALPEHAALRAAMLRRIEKMLRVRHG